MVRLGKLAWKNVNSTGLSSVLRNFLTSSSKIIRRSDRVSTINRSYNFAYICKRPKPTVSFCRATEQGRKNRELEKFEWRHISYLTTIPRRSNEQLAECRTWFRWRLGPQSPLSSSWVSTTIGKGDARVKAEGKEEEFLLRIRLGHGKQEVGQSVKSRALLSRGATLEIYWSVEWKLASTRGGTSFLGERIDDSNRKQAGKSMSPDSAVYKVVSNIIISLIISSSYARSAGHLP